MTFLHLCQWERSPQPKETDKDTIYGIDWDKSQYWKNKIEGNQNMLQKVEINLQGIFDDVLEDYAYRSELLKEFIFEEVRQEEFQDLPSRKRCIFLSPKDVDVGKIAETIDFDLESYYAYKIEVVEKNKDLHYGDMRLLDCNTQSYDEIRNRAFEYWSGTEDRDKNTEILFEGTFRIIETVHHGESLK